MKKSDAEAAIRSRFQTLNGSLNERARRLFVATEALGHGYGGIALVSRATGVAPRTIGAGIKEIRELELLPCSAAEVQRIRHPGAGRKKTSDKYPAIIPALKDLIDPAVRGDPMSPLLWISKSLRHLSAELSSAGFKASASTVRLLLHEIGYSQQANKKTLEGSSHPDRNAQFEFINKKVKDQIEAGQPAISVDAKKKELVGQFKNNGTELRLKGDPEKVKTHDFIDKLLGRVTPYGVYDIANNVGWVSVGVDHDTGAFAVESIRRWWNEMGSERFLKPTSLLITADGGGSNGSRLRLWKLELQRLSDELQIPIFVSHFPPGTSKWNKIEHRLFSFITQNWRGKPLITHEVIVNLIAATTTSAGLTVECEIDFSKYPKGRKVTKQEFASINIKPAEFHGEWNYGIFPTGYNGD